MVNRCMAGECSKISSDHVTLFKFPSDDILIRKWEKQVQQIRAQWKSTEQSFLCSDHFAKDCFEFKWDYASQFELRKGGS